MNKATRKLPLKDNNGYKLTPKQADRFMNYLEVTGFYNTKKLSMEECRWYFNILNTFVWNTD